MDLTSWRRLRFLLGGDDPLTDTWAKKRNFLTWIPVISKRIENYLDRYIEYTTHTEYFDSQLGRLEYFMRGYPINSITSVKSDTTGEFTGSETSESDYYIGKNEDSIVLDSAVTPVKRGLQFIYIGGLANHGVRSTYVLSGEGDTAFAAGDYAEGQTSEAVGYVTAKSGTLITIEVLFGVFQASEVIKGKTDWDATSYTANKQATIASVTSRGLAEAYPDIVQACELEIRYMNDHRHDYENQSSGKEGTQRKDMSENYKLLPEVRALLKTYRNMVI